MTDQRKDGLKGMARVVSIGAKRQPAAGTNAITTVEALATLATALAEFESAQGGAPDPDAPQARVAELGAMRDAKGRKSALMVRRDEPEPEAAAPAAVESFAKLQRPKPEKK